MTTKRAEQATGVEAVREGVELNLVPEIPGTRPGVEDVGGANDLALGAIAALVPPAAAPEGLLDAIEQEIDAPPMDIEIVRARDGGWTQRSDGIWRKELHQDPATAVTMFLLRCAPGAVIEAHLHERDEFVFMLEGEYRSEDGVVRAGDTQVSRAGSFHRAAVTPNGCLLLVRR